MKYKRYIITIILFLFLILSVREVEAGVDYNLVLGERVLGIGDEGVDVAQLQQKLQEQSLYKDRVDGVFGKGTENAVRLFQKDNDLTVDGIAGPKTFAAFPKEKGLMSRMDISREEIILLARVIHGEARGEDFRGKVAVGAVIINRVKSSYFPNSIREVILQQGQFSCILDGQANLYPTNSSLEAAKAALMGYDPTESALYFYNPEVATNVTWISQRPVIKRIGGHVFSR